MAAAIKRTTLKLGMIPADGIGKEVIPVRFFSPLLPRIVYDMKYEYELIIRPLRELLKLLDLRYLSLNLSLYLLDGRSLIRMEKHFLMRLSGEFSAGIRCEALKLVHSIYFLPHLPLRLSLSFYCPRLRLGPSLGSLLGLFVAAPRKWTRADNQDHEGRM